MRLFPFFIAVLICSVAVGQKKRNKYKPVSFQKHYEALFPKKPQYELSGWMVAPGATYMLTTFLKNTETVFETDSSRFDQSHQAVGRFGLYAEVGRFRVLQYSNFIKYIDYGIGYKSLRGKENYGDELLAMPSETVVSSNEAQATFGHHYLTAFFNASNTMRLGKYNFLQHSLGVNIDYAFLQNQQSHAFNTASGASPSNPMVQLHYKLGFGIKMRGNIMLIPSVETPILNVNPFEFGRSSHAIFNSRYRPVIATLRIMFIRPSKGLDCTPVRSRDGVKMPTDMNKVRPDDTQGGGG